MGLPPWKEDCLLDQETWLTTVSELHTFTRDPLNIPFLFCYLAPMLVVVQFSFSLSYGASFTFFLSLLTLFVFTPVILGLE